jgi:cobalt/nickel transport system permease protein
VHIPDGFINLGTSAAAGVISATTVGVSLKKASAEHERIIPMAGLSAAFIFALQMLNFPVGAGVSGHLLGGALAAVLVGPWVGTLVLSVVLIVQSLLMADGGLSALGLNILNMGIVAVWVGWLLFRGLTKALPKTTGWAIVSSMVAAFVSVVAASIAFTIEYAIGGQGGASLSTVFTGMVGVHALIGIGEAIITGVVVGAVLAVRPDLVAGIAGVELAPTRTAPSARAVWAFVVGGLVVALALVFFVAPLADPDPDGLNFVAIDTGFDHTEQPSAIDTPLAGYGVAGIEDERVGTITAGVIGTVVVFAIGLGVVALVRRRRTA